ncbi:MAG: cysteine--tRNA ligase [Magnetococcus sp. WYHC-3]
MGIQLYNTLTRTKEPLVTCQPGRLGIYVCGVTVYDYCHIGHARVMVVFDVVVRHLRASGLDVTYVRNFTDIDDKIIRRAEERGISITTLTEQFIAAFHQDMDALGVLRADIEPKATEHLAEMQTIIQQLVSGGVAYPRDGDVYFAVDRHAGYGKLSGKDLEDQWAGARVAVAEKKDNPLDFVLWKGAKPGEPQWISPWGPGRPGWHIECSAMSAKYLNGRFDIHGGGRDLIFPHHENEIAQSEAATGQAFFRYWMHNGFVNVLADSGEREKMSKSLGNFRTIQDLLKVYPGEVLRLFILNSHYRAPLDFSLELLDAARAGCDRYYTALAQARERLGGEPLAVAMSPLTPQAAAGGLFAREVERFHQAMDDDFNTPQALAVLFEVVRRLNTATDPEEWRQGVAALRGLGVILGLAGAAPEQWFQEAAPGEDGPTAEEISAIIARRTAARQARDWAESDRLRDELAARGVVLKDSREGTTWSRVR